MENGLEQWELAKKIRVHRNTVYEWENDRKGPSKKSIERLVRFFRISEVKLKKFKTGSRFSDKKNKPLF